MEKITNEQLDSLIKSAVNSSGPLPHDEKFSQIISALRELRTHRNLINERGNFSKSTNHPANGPVSLDRLHQISEILSKAAAQSDGGNLGYAMADAVKVIDGVLESIAREQVRCEHAAWSDETFGDVGPVGPLKHLSKEAIEAAAEPDEMSEWADMQFLLWDAQRRAGISDKQITLAMIEKLAVNKNRQWPEPKDGEPRLHIKAQSESVLPGIECDICGHVSTDPEGRHYYCEDNSND